MLSRDIKIKKYNSVTMDLILDFTIPETVKIKKFGIMGLMNIWECAGYGNYFYSYYMFPALCIS